MKYDLLVFIGRFQPFHNGHQSVVDQALASANNVLMLVGSANRSRDMRNPFSFNERKKMIEDTYAPEFQNDSVMTERANKLSILPLNDTAGIDRWCEQVQIIVQEKVKELRLDNPKIGLIGRAKDHSSYYLKLFPTWGSVAATSKLNINATDIREAFWTYGSSVHWMDAEPTAKSYVSTQVSSTTFDFLTKFADSKHYATLKIEDAFIKQYKINVTKYPRIEHTVDAVVIQGGHVLLVRRRSAPGKGKWALPGGFLNPTETLIDGAIRELREETKIKVPEAVLRGSVRDSRTYDDPNRSERGRLITQAFLFRLQDQQELPKVKGSDDADKARWVPLYELDPKDMFEDHYFIIQDLIGA